MFVRWWRLRLRLHKAASLKVSSFTPFPLRWFFRKLANRLELRMSDKCRVWIAPADYRACRVTLQLHQYFWWNDVSCKTGSPIQIIIRQSLHPSTRIIKGRDTRD